MHENPQHVIVVDTGTLLDEAIKNIVVNVPELQRQQVVVLARGADQSAFLNEILESVPDVIVLSEVEPVDFALTAEILHSVLADHVRLIVVRLDDNILEVYDKQSMRMTHRDDLISLIRRR